MIRGWRWIPYPRVAVTAACLAALGLIVIRDAESRPLGLTTLGSGAAALGRWTWLMAQRWRAARAADRTLARRAALRSARRRRAEVERERRNARRAAEKALSTRMAEQRTAFSEAASRAEQDEAAIRAAHEAEIAAEAENLRVLSDDELPEYVVDVFARRGLRPRRLSSEAACDTLLYLPSGDLAAVVRCVPRDRIAGSADIEALDEWRTRVGAADAYLVATAGFSPAAVRISQTMPLTLVEGHLLATWSAGAGASTR